MRLSKAWASHSAQIFTLRLCCTVLSLCLVASIIQGIVSSGRPPIVIERGQELKLVPHANSNHTNDEVRQFVKASLEQLLISETKETTFLTNDQILQRNKRETAFKEKGVRQYIIIHKIQGQGGKITVSFDKILAVNKLRTALATTATVDITKIPRTFENPFGLKLTSYKEDQNEENLAD